MMPIELIEIIPHSTDGSALEALRSTLRMLPGTPDLTTRDGRYFIPDGFAVFACEQQGYVARVVRPERTTD